MNDQTQPKSPGHAVGFATTPVTSLQLAPLSRTLDEFETIVLPYSKDLFRTAMRLLQDRGKAADAVEETFLSVWKNFREYEPGASCRSWLFETLFQVTRQQRREQWAFHEEREEPETKFTAPPRLPAHLNDQEILAALDRLPVIFREVLLLVDVEGFSYADAGRMLSVPEETIAARLRRARTLLITHAATARTN